MRLFPARVSISTLKHQVAAGRLIMYSKIANAHIAHFYVNLPYKEVTCKEKEKK
jgi:hypothetical protein